MNSHFELINGISYDNNQMFLSRYNSFFISRLYVYSHYNEEEIFTVVKKTCDKDEVDDAYIVFKNMRYVHVLNKMTEINDKDAHDLSQFLMNSFKDIICVKFEMLLNKLDLNNCFCCYNNSDICVDLPETVEQYNKRLGSKSRQHYKYYKKKIHNDFENVEFVVNKRFNPEDIYLIDRLIELKDVRCEKNKVINHASSNIDSIKKFAKEFGLLSYIKVNNIPVCILLFYLIGTEFYFEQTAFDEKYYKYSVGRTALYWSIIDAIENKCTKFHFLWKGADYKNHYSATEYQLYDCYIFKSKGLKYFKLVISKRTHGALRNLKHSKVGKYLNPLYKRITFFLKKGKS
jgi:hypothetical protein